MTDEKVQEVVNEMVGRPVGRAEPQVSSGSIDSLSVLKLITRLEKKLAVRIPTDSLQPDDFDSVEVILETLRRVAGI
jgi:acyl carrier protein